MLQILYMLEETFFKLLSKDLSQVQTNSTHTLMSNDLSQVQMTTQRERDWKVSHSVAQTPETHRKLPNILRSEHEHTWLLLLLFLKRLTVCISFESLRQK